MNAFPKSYRFADVLSIINGRNQKKVEAADGQYPIYGSGGIMGWANDYICPENTVVIGRKGSINNPIYVDRKFWNVDTAFGLVPNRNLLLPRYLFYFCVCFDFEKLNTTVTIPSLTKTNLLQIKMFLPSLGEQEKIICRLDKLCHLIELKREQLKQLDVLAKSRFIEMFGDSKAKFQRLGDICSVGSSKRVFVEELQTKGIPFFRGTEVGRLAEDKDIEPTLFITEEHYIALCKHTGKPKIGDLLLPSICPDGRVWCVNSERPFYFKDGRVLWVKVPDAINGCYLRFALSQSIIENYSTLASGITFAELKIVTLKEAPIPLPPLALQNEFAAFIEQLDKSKFSVSQQQKTIDSYQRGIILQLAGGE